ncbi:RNA 2',3'-cyclic phosphodiesterase [Bacillus xiapuensis]|uniref:RNA 2',3'-cyclic phosphodiesterase n=1 Tax=Bacillus xiapuensis TaxID=2014075 RepID=UPI000C23614D|nr:RNA 2',3'-cyclic phosphodiesterase [Bacillus xiapuensis]
MNRQHYFFALALPPESKKQLHQQFLNLHLPFARLVHEQDLHLTLAFLGGAEEDQLSRACGYVAERLEGFGTFSLAVQSFGCFGRVDSPRIFWAGVKDSPRLMSLQQSVQEACGKAGFQLEARPFRPHITLARKWRGEEPFQLPAASPMMEFAAEKVVLYRTHLDRTPKYEEAQAFAIIT